MQCQGLMVVRINGECWAMALIIDLCSIKWTHWQKGSLDFYLQISPLPVCEHLVSTTSKGCPYSRKVSSRRPIVILAIGAFGIGDSDLEFTTFSMHTADNCPSSYIGLPIPELPFNTPLTAEMTSEYHLQAMEEELMKH